MLDFPELFAPAKMVSGLMSMDCRRAIDLYPQTPIWVKPWEFPGALGFLDSVGWFILDHLYKNLDRGPRKCECTSQHHPVTEKTASAARTRFVGSGLSCRLR